MVFWSGLPVSMPYTEYTVWFGRRKQLQKSWGLEDELGFQLVYLLVHSMCFFKLRLATRILFVFSDSWSAVFREHLNPVANETCRKQSISQSPKILPSELGGDIHTYIYIYICIYSFLYIDICGPYMLIFIQYMDNIYIYIYVFHGHYIYIYMYVCKYTYIYILIYVCVHISATFHYNAFLDVYWIISLHQQNYHHFRPKVARVHQSHDNVGDAAHSNPTAWKRPKFCSLRSHSFTKRWWQLK